MDRAWTGRGEFAGACRLSQKSNGCGERSGQKMTRIKKLRKIPMESNQNLPKLIFGAETHTDRLKNSGATEARTRRGEDCSQPR